jgi:hypothetical protein
MKVPDLVGMKFGKLTVFERLQSNNHGEMTWLCVCDCGNKKITTSNKLTHGLTVSCNECRYKIVASKNYKHGMEPINLWYRYTNMKDRCYNPNYELYHRYGGRGIKVCDEWLESFVPFKKWALENGYQEGLTLDRIDNDGNYCPENCRWATVREQANNRSTNRFVKVNNEVDTLANWVRRTGLPYWRAKDMINKGMSGDDVFGPYLKSEKTYVSG